MLDTQTLAREAASLAPLPQAVTRLLSIFASDDWSEREVLDVVKLDPVLTGKVLGAANSALSGAQVRILEVEDAVRRVGSRAVVGFALAAGAKNLLSRALPQFELAEGELWRHSVAALLSAEVLSTHMDASSATAGITAALVHDVGKVLMARFLDVETLDYLKLARLEGGGACRQAEERILSITHGELGAMVAAHWEMPMEIVAAVHHHHDLAHAPEAHARDAALVRVADTLAKQVAPSRKGDDDDGEELQRALEILGLPAAELGGLRAAAQVRFEKLGQAY